MDSNFENLLKTAYARIHAYSEQADNGNLRLAAFACGRAVGYAMAKGDKEMNEKVSILQDEAFKYHIA